MLWIEKLHSANWGEAGWLAAGAYALGCFSTGYWVTRWRTGLDLRELGSGSVGARNAGRILGWSGFTATLLADVAKGMLAVGVARGFAKDDRLVALALLAVVAGHIWPAPLRFRGGKGMATCLGGLLVYNDVLVLAFGALFLIALILLRRTVLPALFAFACLPLVSRYLGPDPTGAAESFRTLTLSILAGMVLVAHRRNLTEELSRFLERRHFPSKPHPPES